MVLRSLLALTALLVPAAQATEQATAGMMDAAQFEASLHFQQGDIDLPGGKTRLHVPGTFRYLPPADSERLLVQGWGNPAGAGTLGMLLPAETSPLSAEGWGVVITYEEDGHVSDGDADGVDYDAMLKQMQEATEAQNAERTKQGYQPLHLVGWAESPRYDATERKLHWAKELSFGDSAEHTLNYNIRVLGREGVLVLNAVASMSQFGGIKQRIPEVLALAEFAPGNTYADFNGNTDKLAGYGLAALVGGAVAAKTGLLAKLVGLLIAAKKFVVLIVLAVAGALKSLFGRLRGRGASGDGGA
jgi:uncharacterized membrane-anchored protein